MTNPISPDMFTSPSQDIVLKGGEVHIWRFFLDTIPLDEGSLSEDEKQRAARFKFSQPRDRFIKTRTALRQILSLYTQQAPESLRFNYQEAGKPHLDGANVRFNVSHAGNIALAAVSHAEQVGIDIEMIREMSPSARQEIENTAFTSLEISEIRKFSKEEQTVAFFRCWTRKEAVVKAKGEGFRGILSFSVSVDAAPQIIGDAEYAVYEVIPIQTMIGALVVPMYEWRIKTFNFLYG